MLNRRVLVIIGAVLLLAGVAGAACSSDTKDLEDRIAALEAQSSGSGDVEALQQQIQAANMVATLNLLDNAGLHEAQEALMAGEEAPDGLNGRVLAGLRSVAVTDWPDELDADAQGLQDALQVFFEALRDPETSDLLGTSTAAHEAWHEFSGDGWTYLAESAGLTTTGDNDHMDISTPGSTEEQMDMTTPESGG